MRLLGILIVTYSAMVMASQKYLTEFTLTEPSSNNPDTLKQQVLNELQNLDTTAQHHIDNITITTY